MKQREGEREEIRHFPKYFQELLISLIRSKGQGSVCFLNKHLF